MLGLFDSGLGGLTVVRRVRELLPSHDLTFFADQLHVPYGDRAPEELHGLLERNLAWLDESGADAIVMACNTSCAMGERFGWPSTRAIVLDLIDSAAIAVERDGHSRIGVIATTATARSGAYARSIARRMPDAWVTEIAAPELVPLVEAGKLSGDEPRAAVRAVCEQLPPDVDAVILACTHYPLLDEHFAAVLGSGVVRIDPAIVQAERTAALAAERRFASGSGKLTCITNGDQTAFNHKIETLFLSS